MAGSVGGGCGLDLRGESVEAACDVAEGGGELPRLGLGERHVRAAHVGVVEPLREPGLRFVEVVACDRGLVDDAVKLIESYRNGAAPVCDAPGAIFLISLRVEYLFF